MTGRVVVVTGGGGGIGAAVAEELGRQGAFVVTLDPLVSVDGAEQLPPPEQTTAGRIVAAGGSARASSVSVTDGDAVRGVFAELVEEHGKVDAVINVAGITRPTSFASGTEEDWLDVLAVHLHGYLNILAAALPIMATTGYGRILGVTSGSGWRSADAGAYGCAKRVVASLTWELGRNAPPGVVVNAMSPIAMTRMVTAALERARQGGGDGAGSTSSGGLSLGSMPTPEQLGPFGAYLVGDEIAWSNGRVYFAGGPEVAVIDEPRLLEVVRSEDVDPLASVLEAVTTGALVPAEVHQATGGGSNPRFGSIFDDVAGDRPTSGARSCAVVTDRPDGAAAVTAAIEGTGVTCCVVPVDERARGFGGAAEVLASVVERTGPLDAVVVALGGRAPAAGAGWEQVLAEHEGIVDRVLADAGWLRAVADYAVAADRPVRAVVLTDATTAGGRSRAHAAAQLARAGRAATGERVAALAVSVETAGDERAVGEVAAHLVGHPDAVALAGAELVVGAGWFGLRSHPRPGGSITFGGPAVPAWLDGTLREMAR